jgi:hypothetical protein
MMKRGMKDKMGRAMAMRGDMADKMGRAMTKPMGMKKGGKIDGVAKKGKTKGKMVKMAYGGKC